MNPFFTSMGPGVRMLLILSLALYVSSLVLGVIGINLHLSLSLTPALFRQGSYWQIGTYWLLPGSLMDWFFNALLVWALGRRLEAGWSTGQLLAYALIVALCAGLMALLLLGKSPWAFTGMTPVGYGLMMAWVRMYGDEEVLLMGCWPMTLRKLFLIMIGLGFLLVLLSGFSIATLLMQVASIFGGAAGWVYLSIRWRRNLKVAAQSLHSSRIRRLEP
ncbi:MAG: rhomboid family intramembrane serine protease [Verrucomicrobiae bacterium]|nr:rhomboid family intramembrane serine protease [Verrucomicrobiae bacterium]